MLECLIIIFYFKSMQSESQAYLASTLECLSPEILPSIYLNSQQSKNRSFIPAPSGQVFLPHYLNTPLFISESNRTFYTLNQQEFKQSGISQIVRAKLRCWLYDQCSKRNITRNLCCLTNTLIDLYLCKGGKVTLEQFHALGLSCLLLANKLTDNVKIPIRQDAFPRRQLNELQLRVLNQLGYRVNPLNYVELSFILLEIWNQFAAKHHLWIYSFTSGNVKIQHENVRCSILFELLDQLALDLKNMKHFGGTIQILMMKVLIEKSYSKFGFYETSIEDEVLIQFWVNPQKPSFRKHSLSFILQNYLKQVINRIPWIKNCISGDNFDLQADIRHQMELHVSSIEKKSDFVQSYSLDFFTKFQSRKSKGINYRKSSSDTTA